MPPKTKAAKAEKITVRMLVPATGGREIGSEHELPQAEAKRLFEAGFAEPVATRGAQRTGAGPAGGAETR